MDGLGQRAISGAMDRHLAQPWNTDTNIITSSTGDFIFTDTVPPGQMRFYRLVQIPSGQGGPLGTSP